MSDDFSMGQAMGDVGGGGQPSPEEQNAGAAVAATGSYLEKTAANVKNQADADQVESTYNAKTHTWSLDNVPHDALQTILQNAKQFGHITQIYQKQIEDNQRQQEQLKQHPFANALAQIAANVGASSKDPLVRGLGGAAQALNPTMGQLQGQGMELMKGAESAAQGQMGIADRLLQHQAMRQSREDTLDQRKAEEGRRVSDEARKVKEDQTRNTRDVTDKQLAAAQKGEAAPPDVLNKLFTESGMDAHMAAAQTDAIVKTNAAALSRINADRALQERRTAALERGVTAKSSDKEEADAAIEDTAQELAKWNLSAMNTVTSMRGDQRIKVFARAMKINPEFSTGEALRRIQMEKDFTTGKKGDGLQSFDTFLMHAGGLTDTFKNIQMTDNRLLNHSLNWWRKNMKGTPELARMETAQEPVGKEFEKFLLATGSGSGGALYADDRRKVDALLNPDIPLSVQFATVAQMGKTAKDKFTAMNQQYKRVTKKDIPYPFSEEGTAAAKKLGIDLSKSSTGSTATKYPWEK
jgi:hypothetical protein